MSDAKYKIKILNWDKYQKEIKGNRRNWVAISTDLLHDPDIVDLTIEQRWLWVAMLLHAGRVGVEYELSISSARLLFKLRPGWRGVVDFEALKNHGFIDFQSPTRRTRKDNNTYPTDKAHAPSVRDQVWKIGPEVIGNAQTDRAYLGKLIKEHGEGSVLHALTETQKHGTGDPKSYVRGILRDKQPSDGFGVFDD